MRELRHARYRRVREVGAHVSLAGPIEMVMGHGMPPIQKVRDFSIAASLSADVECTLTTDAFTQMRAAIALQRAR